MAKFGIDAAGMSKAETPHYIAPGVVDQSGAIGINAIASAVNMGAEAYDAKQRYDLRTAQDANVEHLEQSIKSEQLTKEMAPAISAIENIWDQFDSGVDSFDAVQALEKSLSGPKAEMAKLTRAREQGLLSDSAFLIKNTALVRDAVTKNPWMEAELYKQANTHLAALGITSLLDEREQASNAIAKKERDDYEFQMGRAKGYDLPWYTGMPMAELTAMVNKKAGEVEMASNIQRALESGIRLTQLDARNSVANGSIDKGISAMTNTYNDSFISELRASPKDYPSIITNNELKTKQIISQARNMYGLAAVEDGPVKDKIDQMEKDFLAFNTLMREAGSGELALKQAQNSRDYTLAVQEDAFAGKHNKFAMDHAKSVAQILQMTESQMSTEVYKKTVTSLLKFANSENLLGIGDRDKVVTSGEGVRLINLIGNKVDGFSNNTLQLTTSMVLNETNKFIARNPDNLKEGVDALKASLSTTALKQDEIRRSSINPEMMKSVNTSVDIVMKKHLPDMMAGIAKVEASPANAGQKVVLDIVMGGMFVLKTGDPKSDEVMNKLYATDVNNALDSFAAVRKQTREQAALEFYQTYYPAMAGDADLTGVFPNTPEEVSRVGTPPAERRKKPREEVPKEVKEATAATKAQMKARNETKAKVLTIERADMEKEIKTSEAALKTAISKGNNDTEYLNTLRRRIKAAKETIVGIDNEMGR